MRALRGKLASCDAPPRTRHLEQGSSGARVRKQHAPEVNEAANVP